MTKIKGVLLDIDGTLAWKKTAIHGAAQAIGYLRSHGYPFRLLTNISARQPEHIAAELAEVGHRSFRDTNVCDGVRGIPA